MHLLQLTAVPMRKQMSGHHDKPDASPRLIHSSNLQNMRERWKVRKEGYAVRPRRKAAQNANIRRRLGTVT